MLLKMMGAVSTRCLARRPLAWARHWRPVVANAASFLLLLLLLLLMMMLLFLLLSFPKLLMMRMRMQLEREAIQGEEQKRHHLKRSGAWQTRR